MSSLKGRRTGGWLVGLVTAAINLGTIGYLSAAEPAPAPKFKIYYQMSWADGTTAKAPTTAQLSACGIEKVPLVTEATIFGTGMPRYHQPLDLTDPKLQAAADKIAAVTPVNKLVVLNVEKQGWLIKPGDPYLSTKVQKYKSLIGFLRSQAAITAKGTLLGYFGEAPVNDYFGYISGRGQVPANLATNAQTIQIAKASDALFPVMYTLYRENGSRG